MKIDWKRKLTSRKLWAAVVSFAALLVVALGGTEAQATQITALIMAGATVVAYIIGEGLVDAASAGATANISGNPTITGLDDVPTAGKQATTPPSTPVVDQADSAAVDGTPTGAVQAAKTKQNTALPG